MGIRKRLHRENVRKGIEEPIRHDKVKAPLRVVVSGHPDIPVGTLVYADHYETPDGRRLDLK